MFYPAVDRDLQVNSAGGGDTGAPQVHANAVPREWYHTDWVADRTIAWLDSLDAADDWFCWMSVPDPHHPWDPPQSEVGRVDWRDVPLPAGYPGEAATRYRYRDGAGEIGKVASVTQPFCRGCTRARLSAGGCCTPACSPDRDMTCAPRGAAVSATSRCASRSPPSGRCAPTAPPSCGPARPAARRKRSCRTSAAASKPPGPEDSHPARTGPARQASRGAGGSPKFRYAALRPAGARQGYHGGCRTGLGRCGGGLGRGRLGRHSRPSGTAPAHRTPQRPRLTGLRRPRDRA